MLHHLAAGPVARDLQQRVEPRRDDDRLLGRLARERAVRERARGAVEIPRTGAPERLAHVLRAEPVALGERAPGGEPAGVAGQREQRQPGGVRGGRLAARHVRQRPERADWDPRHRPAVNAHHLHVGEVRPLRLQLPRHEREPVVALGGGGLGRWERRRDRIPAFSGHDGPESPLPRHEQLREVPGAGGDLGQVRGPAGSPRARLDVPARDHPAAAQERSAPRGGPDHRRGGLRARVVGTDAHRLGQIVPAVGHLHHEGPGSARFTRSDVPQPVEGPPQRPDGPPGGTIGRVVAARPHVHVGRGR